MGVWVGDHYCEIDCPPCGLFEGRSGKAVVLTLTFLAFVTYVSIFTIRKRSGKDTRSWKVFWLDLMKMGIGQGCAWGINVLNSHRNSEMAAEEVSEAQRGAQFRDAQFAQFSDAPPAARRATPSTPSRGTSPPSSTTS